MLTILAILAILATCCTHYTFESQSTQGIVPTNTYNTKDGKSLVIGANSDSLFKRLMLQAIAT